MTGAIAGDWGVERGLVFTTPLPQQRHYFGPACSKNALAPDAPKCNNSIIVPTARKYGPLSLKEDLGGKVGNNCARHLPRHPLLWLWKATESVRPSVSVLYGCGNCD